MIRRTDGTATVVDIHAHLGPAAQPGQDGGRSGRLLAAMDLGGVDVACVFASAARGSDYRVETELILELASSSPRIVPFARAHPYWGAEAVADLEALARSGARGLKLHPFMDGAFAANDRALVHPLVRTAADHGLVVLVHSGWGFNSAPGLIADLARWFPTVPVVMGHSGRYGYHREAAAVGADLPNLHYDIAGLATPGAVDELVSLVGGDRVLLGSDHPHSPMGFEVEKVARWSALGGNDLRAVVGLNALRLLGIERPEVGPTVTVREPGETSEGVQRP